MPARLVLVVESGAPCDGTDVSIAVGDACIPVTTATAGSLITNANFNPTGCPGGGPPCNVPTGGPILNTGIRWPAISTKRAAR